MRTSCPTTKDASRAVGSLAVGAAAVGALAFSAVAVGALAIGAAIGRLVVVRAGIRRLEIEELVVRPSESQTSLQFHQSSETKNDEMRFRDWQLRLNPGDAANLGEQSSSAFSVPHPAARQSR